MNAARALALGAAVLCGAICPRAVGAQTSVEVSTAAAVEILQHSRDRAALERAAVALASSRTPEDIARLGEFLRDAGFLARFDDLGSSADRTRNVQKVFSVLATNPSRASERLCIGLSMDPVFLAVDDRRIYLLPALAAVKPLSEEGAAVFRRANRDGYGSATAPLLVKNGSPRALALFEEMVLDRTTPITRRVDALRASVLPWRTNPEVLECVRRILGAPIEPEVAVGAIESVFDYQSRRWFGVSRAAPKPPPWESAPRDALRKVLALAKDVRRRELRPELVEAIDRTVETVNAILAGSR